MCFSPPPSTDPVVNEVSRSDLANNASLAEADAADVPYSNEEEASSSAPDDGNNLPSDANNEIRMRRLKHFQAKAQTPEPDRH